MPRRFVDHAGMFIILAVVGMCGSTVVLAGPDHARLLHLPSGETRDSFSLSFGEDFQSERLGITKSAMGAVVALYDYSHVYSFTSSGRNLSRRNVDGGIYSVFLDNVGDWVGVAVHNTRDTSGYILVYAANDITRVARSGDISSLRHAAACRSCKDIASLSNGILAIRSVSGWTTWRIPWYAPFETLFAEFDPDSMTISTPFAIPGIYILGSGESVRPDTYLRVFPPDTVQLVRFNR